MSRAKPATTNPGLIVANSPQLRPSNSRELEFHGLWERLNNPGLNPVEFDGIRIQAGLNNFTSKLSTVGAPRQRGGQSQRNCVLQPRVARHELPWETGAKAQQPQRGCGPAGEGGRNPVGVETITGIAPRVARASQPGALGRNPFGIQPGVDEHLKKMGAVWK